MINNGDTVTQGDGGVNFSRPFTLKSQSPESAAGSPQQSGGSNQSQPRVRRTSQTIHPTRATPPMATLREPFEQPGMVSAEYPVLSELDSRGLAAAKKISKADANGTCPSGDENIEALSPPPALRSKPRYYATQLSEEDKHALAVGKLNHNLKKWTPSDLIRFQECRLELVHHGLPNRDELLRLRMTEIRQGHQFAQQKKDSELDMHQRHSSAPASSGSRGYIGVFAQIIEPQSASTSANEAEVPVQVNGFTRLRTAGEHPMYPSRRPESYNSHSFSSSIRLLRPVSSPLRAPGLQNRARQTRTDITFDSFLAPHVTGKGEAYRGAENAVEVTDGDNSKDGIEAMKLTKPFKSPVRPLRSMASMPSLRSRKSQGNERSIE